MGAAATVGRSVGRWPRPTPAGPSAPTEEDSSAGVAPPPRAAAPAARHPSPPRHAPAAPPDRAPHAGPRTRRRRSLQMIMPNHAQTPEPRFLSPTPLMPRDGRGSVRDPRASRAHGLGFARTYPTDGRLPGVGRVWPDELPGWPRRDRMQDRFGSHARRVHAVPQWRRRQVAHQSIPLTRQGDPMNRLTLTGRLTADPELR
jgi:hypothetical protein